MESEICGNWNDQPFQEQKNPDFSPRSFFLFRFLKHMVGFLEPKSTTKSPLGTAVFLIIAIYPQTMNVLKYANKICFS